MKRDHNTDDTPLLHWKPPVSLLLFPLARRVGKIRQTAAKLATKATAKHVASYRRQVTDCLVDAMKRAGVSDGQMQRELSAFWEAVECECCRHDYHRTDDGAA